MSDKQKTLDLIDAALLAIEASENSTFPELDDGSCIHPGEFMKATYESQTMRNNLKRAVKRNNKKK